MREDNTNVVEIAIVGIVVLIAIIFIVANFPFVIVNAGHRGVVMNYGKVQDKILDEGIHWKAPFVQSVKQINVKTKTTEIKGVAGSSDSQAITFTAKINWKPNAGMVNVTYKNVGNEDALESNYILTKAPDAIKASMSKFEATKILANREAVRAQALEILRHRVGEGIVVEDISLTDIDFSPEFNAAIEAKVTAEQNALAEKNKLEAVKYQAQQKIETAKAEAESIRIQTEALSQNQNLIELEKAKRWNGVLPQTVVGGAVPFFDIK